ncbi:MAG: SusC/RagA family TonB-linked outer membrane protein [Bacteroidota bacterium]
MKRLCIALTLFVLAFSGYTQQINVSGKVISGSDQQTIPGATVQVLHKPIGTVTDIDGNYSLKGVGSKDSLIFSSIGFVKQIVAIGGKTVINITLQVTSTELKEVVVTALGISRQKRELGFATAKLSGDLVTRSSSASVITAMTGRVANVTVSSGDGVEGGSTRVVIRGNNNLTTNNQPLIVIDGIPVENNPGMTNIGRGVDWGNAINNVNSFDIESYNILKGGSASALYGSRGANGVILITTKRGQQQKGIGVTYNFSEKIIHPYRYREVQNKYGGGGPIALTPPKFPTSANGDTLKYPGIYGSESFPINQQGQTSNSAAEFGYYGSSVSWGPKMNGEMVKWWDGVMRPWSPQPDNLSIPYHDGFTTTHNIAASGGGPNGTMRVSITNQDQKPIIDNSNSNQTTVNVAGNLKASQKVRVDMSISYINYKRLNSPMVGEDGNSINKGLLYSWPRSYQGEDKANYANADGAQNKMENYPYKYVSQTIWWNYYNNNTTLTRDKYIGSISLIYDVTPWLNAVFRTGKDFTLSQFETKNKPIDVLGLKDGYYGNALNREVSNNSDFLITATKDKFFKSDINVKFSIGGNAWSLNQYAVSGHSGTWYYPNMYSMVNFTEPTYKDSLGLLILDHTGNSPSNLATGSSLIRKKINSAYSFLNLGYKNYLFADITGRNDWSSTLPQGKNSYFYPSLTLSFIASEALKLQEKLPWMNFLKLRASFAQTATDADPYQTEFYYKSGFFGGQQSTVFPDTIPPYKLIPQRVNTYETGLNIAILDNRIDFDITYYYARSFDQILNLPAPISSGSNSILINDGVLTNKGIEIVLTAVPVQTKNFIFKTGITFGRNRNKIVSLGAYGDKLKLADIWGLNGPAMYVKAGEQYGTIYGYDYVYDSKGRRIVNDEGTKYEVTTDRVPVGNAAADFVAGWTTDFSYKNFRLTTLVDCKWGGDIYCGSYVIGLQTGQSPETLLERDGGGLPYTDPAGNTSNIGVVLPGVHADGTPNTTVVHYYYKYMPNAGGWGHFLTTPGIVENTWVKLREVSLSYTLPAELLKKQKIFQSLSLSLTGRDLFYLYTTLPDKINPEGILGSGNAQGFEWASYPGTRSVIFGINASF